MNNSPLSKEFQLEDGLIYLNHAAVSPWPKRTVEAVKEFAKANHFRGSLDYPAWLQVEDVLRSQLSELINAPSKNDIALLKNTSEALSVVAYGLSWKNGDNIVSSDQEFPSNRIVWESLSPLGVKLKEADLCSTEHPEDALFALADENTRLITISSVQFATGIRLNLEKIGRFCKERRILFCVDAIQSIGAVRFDVQSIQADFVMADGHKWMLGPEGLAVFYSTPEARKLLSLKQFGWHMTEQIGDFDRRDWTLAESGRRFECGSPNMLGIHALNASLSLLLEAGMDKIEKEVLKRTEYIFEALTKSPDWKLITPVAPGSYAGIVTFSHTTLDNEKIFKILTGRNIFCSLRGGGIRLSPHFYTPLEHLDRVINILTTEFQSP
ncbi:MAG: aminotransferase class V-fold PLP-dependent enzyme [Nitrospira sp.]|nr:aminotransferase class V-fold PLP-dependent enzyme [bacterium]MBL7048127.1 aminotransferase class V-fold PLP-dependent enzyme [Nitrospira sp.]